MNKEAEYFTNKYASIFDAILEEDIKGVKFFLRYSDVKDSFALRLAVKTCQIEIVKLLLLNCYDIDDYCMMAAERNGDCEMMDLLVEYGASEL